jgi:hypothetical protein
MEGDLLVRDELLEGKLVCPMQQPKQRIFLPSLAVRDAIDKTF